MKSSNNIKALGATGATLRALALVGTSVTAMALFTAPAFAQGTPAPQAAAAADEEGPVIVVTGSILRQVDTETSAPITTITAADLDKRGINTGQDAILKLSANNGPALTNSFTANGAFAGGAAAVSLRGLSTNSTLVLFDGMRASYYPLADDGSRNFVDLNTIPDDIIERIDTLKDGASSTYGADAIAGVVNIITKREFKGISARAEFGGSQHGLAANQRLSITAGTGDIDDDGYNFYISGFYYNSSAVYNRQLPAPFNSSNQVGIGGPNGQAYGIGANGLLSNNGTLTAQADGNFSLGNLYVRPSDATTNVAITGSRYQLLTSACLTGTPYTPTAADRAQSANATVPNLVCNEDGINKWGAVAPHIERFGGSARFTTKLGEAEGYLEVNLQQTTSDYSTGPSTIRGNAPTGIFYPRFSTSSAALPNYPGSLVLNLPVYVCPVSTVGACNVTNGTLNPNNPFAAAGQNALLIGALPNVTSYRATRSRVYRAAAGLAGTVFDDLDYKVDMTAMHTDLKQTFAGYVYIQSLLDLVKDGSFNFINPLSNSRALLDKLAPTRINNASSDLYQAQITFGKTLATLPGGPLQLGFGGSIYYEAVDAPSANSDINGPTQRYFVLNAFGTAGHRVVSSLFAEVRAPVIDAVTLTAAGRYDHYSSGQSAFSPKAGIEISPLRILKLRGTYSRGFRIPSFGEANALPTTGFVANSAALFNNTYLAQYGCTVATFSSACPAYIRSGSYGQTTLASPNLQPEKSRSFTAGVVFEPIRNVTFTVDYYNIKKTGAITQPSNAPALNAYYNNLPIPAGYTVIPDAPDTNNPTAKPKVAFVQSQLINANTIASEGIDFGAKAVHDFGGFKVTSDLSASVLLNLSTEFPDGTIEKYVGTLGNFNLTAGSGTFRWHGYWSNTIEKGPVAVTGTVNYTSGYDLSAMDQGTDYKDCGLSPGYLGCHVRSYVTFDINANVKVSDNISVYLNVLNAFATLPAIDPVTYGAYLYNPVQAGDGIYGRSFRGGVKVKL